MPVALTYHDVVSREALDTSGFPGPLAARYKLEPALFNRHLDALQGSEVGIEVDFIASRSDQVLLTFDDGGASAGYIADQLEGRGWRGCFFVVSSRIGTPGFLSAAAIIDLHARGHSIGSHSHSHPTYMGKLSHRELVAEWGRSRDIIAELIGSAPLYASIPGGFASAAVLSTAEECGYRLLFTSEPDHRIQQTGRLTISGRYSIWATTPAKRAAAYASGSSWARQKLALEWGLKQRAKRLTPGLYEKLRRVRAG